MDSATAIITLTLLYFFPAIIAWGRHHQTGMVFVIDIFLGWTVIGWVVALAIACGDQKKDRGVTIGSGS